MAHQNDYRKPRTKELRDLTWNLPYPLRVKSVDGNVLYQNRAAEENGNDGDWSSTPLTWQNVKAFLEVPAAKAGNTQAVEQVDDLESTVERLKKQKRDTARKKRQAESKAKEEKKRADEVQKTLEKLQERVDALSAENETLREQSTPSIPAEQEELQHLKARVSELEGENKRLVEAAEKSRSVEAVVSPDVSEMERLRTLLAQADEDRTAAEIWMEELEHGREALDIQHQKTVAELQQVKSEFEAFREQVAEADAQRELEEQLEQKVAEFEALEKSFEEEQQAFQRQKQELQEKLSLQEGELQELKVGFESKSREQKAVPNLESELNDLREALKKAQRNERRLEERSAALEELNTERDALLKDLRKDLDNGKERERELKSTLALYAEMRGEMEESRKSSGALREQIQALQARELNLKQELVVAKERLLAGGGAPSGGSVADESMSVPMKNQLDFVKKRLADTEKKLDQSVAQLKEEQAQNQKSKESERLAFQDDLTGLPNRHMIKRYLDYARQQAAASGKGIALFLIDLDGFRVLNSAYGRDWGDALLKAVGERLNGMRGGSHLVARHSQDRFILLAAELDRGQLGSFVPQASKSLLEALAYPFEVDGEKVKVTGSVGVCIGPVQGDDPENLYRFAEIALESSKRAGTGRYTLFDDRLAQTLKQEKTYKTQMLYAAEKEEFKAVYQPVYHLGKGQVMGLELLMRWEHRDQKTLKPSDFLEIAVDSGLILNITERLWPRVFAQLRRWQQFRKGLTLSINLSDKELLTPGLVERTLQQIGRAGIEPMSLIFEVRDRSELRMSPSWWRVLQEYAQAGFGLCLDDYGSDASMFGTLGFHGFWQAKVLVDERNPFLPVSPQARPDIVYCAKGIQNKLDKKSLSRAGFQQAQGYGLSRPIAEHEVEGLLS